MNPVQQLTAAAQTKARWGTPPWAINFRPEIHSLPREIDFAVIGGGFSGLAAAASLRRLEPRKTVALFEAECLGAGSSGHTGGMTLAESAAGDLPGLGDVLTGFSAILHDLQIDCGLTLSGAWELARSGAIPDSPIAWNDSGELRVSAEIPGGTVDPGKLLNGLARAAEQAGVMIFERSRIDALSPLPDEPNEAHAVELDLRGVRIRAGKVLIATNAQSLELSSLVERAEPKFTLALATEPLSSAQLTALGLATGRPFYTADFPYLWGRLSPDNGVIFGSGLVHLRGWSELSAIDIEKGTARQLLTDLERRVHGLHPELRNVQVTHRWGGPILIGEQWRAVLAHHPRDSRVFVLGAYAGHGVALSVYLGRWVAEAMLERKPLPNW